MKQVTACDRCGLRTVRYELEKQGVIIRFCDECYWNEVEGGDTAAPSGEEPAARRDGARA